MLSVQFSPDVAQQTPQEQEKALDADIDAFSVFLNKRRMGGELMGLERLIIKTYLTYKLKYEKKDDGQEAGA